MNVTTKRPRRRRLNDSRLPMLLASPSMLIILGVLIFPILFSIFMSLNDLNVRTRTFEFVGLGNYANMFSDSFFINSIQMTLLFTVLSVTIEMALGVAIAMVLNKEFKGRGFVRGLMILPWALPSVVNAVMWQWIYDANYGALNALLTQLGIIDSYQVWLGRSGSAFIAVLVANIWKETPYVVLLTIAALSNVPQDLYEAASIDGSNAWQSFWRITLPMIKPVLLIMLITKTIWALQTFDLVYIMTKGGPGGVTEFITFYIQKTSFKFQKFGYGSAMSFTLSMICLALTTAYSKAFVGKEYSKQTRRRRGKRGQYVQEN